MFGTKATKNPLTTTDRERRLPTCGDLNDPGMIGGRYRPLIVEADLIHQFGGSAFVFRDFGDIQRVWREAAP
jgi:hypothetical protein